VGRALLERARAYGEARGAQVRFTWATLDPRAQARHVLAGMAPRWPIYRLDGDAASVARLKAQVGLGPQEGELPCDPAAAEKLMAEVLGDGRAEDLAHWRGDGGAAVAIERGGEIAAFAYRRGQRIGPAAGHDETALLRAVAAAAVAGVGSGGGVTMRVPGACASLLQALVGCGFRIGSTPVQASRLFGRPELYLLRVPSCTKIFRVLPDARPHPTAASWPIAAEVSYRGRGGVAAGGAANRPRGGRGGRADCRPRARLAPHRVHRGHGPAPRPGVGPDGHRLAVERGRRARPQCLRRARRLGLPDARTPGAGQS
jgi:hypothetical protein